MAYSSFLANTVDKMGFSLDGLLKDACPFTTLSTSDVFFIKGANLGGGLLFECGKKNRKKFVSVVSFY